MKIALAQTNPTVGDFAGNTAAILEYAARARQMGAELAIFPELSICGYPPADLIEKQSFIDSSEQALQQVAAATKELGIAILCGAVLPSGVETGKRARNVAALCRDGAVAFIQQKMLLPFYDVFDEQRYFEPAQSQSLVDISGQSVAITICEDAWNDKDFWPHRLYQNDPVERLMTCEDGTHAKPQLLLNISASPFWKGKAEVRRRMIAAIAKRHQSTVVMVNQVGGNDSLIFDGGSFAVDKNCDVIAQAKRFSEDLIVFDTEASEPVKLPSDNEIEQLYQALIVGTRDYVRKCGFRDVTLGLSGGIDSAVVAAIAVEALGKEHVTGIGMPSEYSSSGSISDSEKLAKNLQISFKLMPIREVFDAFNNVLKPVFEGSAFGLAEENLQPRIRGTLLMAMSNKSGSLVLTTGNKSEMAVGYCTLYGDMVGALAVIGDVIKTRVYELARYINREREIIPEDTIAKPPSAELRPGQKDTDSLPPYDVLDPIVEAYVERYESAAHIAQTQGVDIALVKQVLALIERSEYKRQQAAPVLKVTQKSFGNGRRFPIAARVQF